MFFAAARKGARYAAALGGATAAFVALDEGAGWARERVFGPRGGGQWRVEESEGRPRRVSWRQGEVSWGDGMSAGTVLGLGVGTICQ